MIFPFKLPSADRLRVRRQRRRQTSSLRSLPDHVRRDIGLLECSTVGDALARHYLDLLGR
jgi:hypothetical protein